MVAALHSSINISRDTGSATTYAPLLHCWHSMLHIVCCLCAHVCSPPFSSSRVKLWNAPLSLSHVTLCKHSACNRCSTIHSLDLIGSLPEPYIQVSKYTADMGAKMSQRRHAIAYS